MRLSSRLAKECDRSNDSGFVHSTDVRLLLAEASELAKRYEDAPVLEGNSHGVVIATCAPNQRVRIVMDKEG